MMDIPCFAAICTASWLRMGSKALLPAMNTGLGSTEVSLQATVIVPWARAVDAPKSIPAAPAKATIFFL